MAAFSFRCGRLERPCGQHLSKQNDVGSHVSAAVDAHRHVRVHPQFPQLMTRSAFETARSPNVPVQLNDIPRTRLLMQIVDVLRHQSEIIKSALPFGKRFVRSVRLN